MAGLRDALRALKGIRAFHGSPHDFERFSLDAIGTGEGAQAYGHGLYFAENEAVARGYRDQISKDWRRTGTGDLFAPSSLEHLNVRVRATNGELDNAIETARSVLAREDMPEATRAMARRDLARLEEIQAGGGLEPHQGRMYEVNLNAAPDEFLDWDAPLAQQGERVTTAANRMLDPGWDSNAGWAEGWKPTGEDLIGPHRGTEGQRRANVLRDVGIKGIRYLDQGSRGNARWIVRHPKGGVNEFADEASARTFAARYPDDGYVVEPPRQSRNYTVLDDSIIDVLRKYAVPGAVGLGGGGITLREALADRMT